MNLLAIVGSPRKGKATDTLVDRAIEGARSKAPDCHVKKLHLIDHDIHQVKNLCDRASVMKNGKLVGTVHVNEVSEDDILSMILETIYLGIGFDR